MHRDPVDIHVGQRLRQAREDAELSQAGLAEELKVASQQVQKYEKAENRISASRLYHAAQALGRPVQWFFEGYRCPVEASPKA